jgi:hypothetical protein
MSESGQTRFIDRSTVRRIDVEVNPRVMKPCAEFVANQAIRYELRFLSLFEGGSSLAFPCDADGHVNFVGMSERSRSEYFYARKAVGHEFSVPATVVVE